MLLQFKVRTAMLAFNCFRFDFLGAIGALLGSVVLIACMYELLQWRLNLCRETIPAVTRECRYWIDQTATWALDRHGLCSPISVSVPNQLIVINSRRH
jgi:hypothetical protein